MINTIFKNPILAIAIFLPFSFVVGISITEIFLFILISITLINKNLNFEIYKSKLILFFFIFAIYIALNSFYQIHDDLKYSSFFYFRYLLLLICVCSTLMFIDSIKINDKLNFFYICIIIILIIVFDSILQFFYGINLLGYQIINGRVSGFFGNELILGSFLLKIFPIIVWQLTYFQIEKKINKNLLIVFFTLYIFTIIISGERTSSALALVFVFLIIIFLPTLRKLFIISLLNVFLILFIITVFKVGSYNPLNRIILKTYDQIIIKQNQERLNNKDYDTKKINKKFFVFSKDHEGHYLLAFKLFKDNPFFGSGPKGFRHYCRTVNYEPKIGICSTHPHNFFLQILSELGLIGVFFYLLFQINLIINFFKVLNSKRVSIYKSSFLVISLGVLVNIFPLLPSGNFFNNWNSIIIYYIVSLYYLSLKKIKI